MEGGDRPDAKEEADDEAHPSTMEGQKDLIQLTVLIPQTPFKSLRNGLDPCPIHMILARSDTLADAKVAVLDCLEGVHLGSVGLFAKKAGSARLDEHVSLETLLKEGLEALDEESLVKVTVHLKHQDYTLAEARSHLQRLRDQCKGYNTEQNASEIIDGGLGTVMWVGGESAKSVEQDASKSSGNGVVLPKKRNKNKKKGVLTPGAILDKSAVPPRWPGEHAFDDFEARLDGMMQGKDGLSLHQYIPSFDELHPTTISCFHALVISAWDPPPAHWRTRGHLLYIHFKALEGMSCEITSSTKGFFLNNCTDTNFDPKPREGNKVYHTLTELLCQFSPEFSQTFIRLQTHLAQQDALTLSPISLHLAHPPWIVQPPKSKSHHADPGRLQETFLATGSRISGDLETARDWNEDLQSARELPRSTFAERVTRDRALGRVYHEFAAAAVKGAMSIARGNLAPVNPAEESKNWLWVSGNIFFTRAVDVAGIFGGAQIQRQDEAANTFPDLGSDAAAHVAASKDLAALRAIGSQDLPGICTLATTLIDFQGHRWVAQGVVPGIFRREESRGDGTEELNPLEHPNAIMYGLTEDQKQIRTHQYFETLFKPIAKGFHLAAHPMVAPQGSSEASKEIWLSGDVKGMMGADGRKYIMECWRMSLVDSEWQQDGAADEAADKYPHKMALLRLELVQQYWDTKMREWVLEQAKQKSDAENKETIKINVEEFELAFNPDAFTPYYERTKAAFPGQAEKDEAIVRLVSLHLREVVIPSFIDDVALGQHNIPLDGSALTRSIHRRGINVRYLGTIAQVALEKSQGSPYDDRLCILSRLAVQEMVVRSVKRIARRRQAILDSDTMSHITVIVALLNELFGGNGPARHEIAHSIKVHYRYSLALTWFDHFKRIPMLREVALRLGLQIVARQYRLEDEAPFVEDDILNLVPLIKSSIPKNATAEETYEAGRQALGQENKQLGLELLSESLQFYEQFYGVVHPETARAISNVGMLYHRQDENALALEMQRKSTTISERVLGFDAPEVIQNILNLAMFEHLAGHHEIALRYLREGIERWFVVAGHDHPELVSTLNNISYIFREFEQGKTAKKSQGQGSALALSLAQYSRWSTGKSSKRSLSYAQASQTLAGVLASQGQFLKALPIQQEAQRSFEGHLGSDAPLVKEADTLVKAIVGAAVKEKKMSNGHVHRQVNGNGIATNGR